MISDYWTLTKDTDVLSEYARRSLKRSITQTYSDQSGTVTAFSLDPAVEKVLSESVNQSPAGFHLAVPPEAGEELLAAVGAAVDRMVAQGQAAIALVAPNLRLLFRRFVEPRHPSLVVLSYNDLLPNSKIEIVHVVRLSPAGAGQQSPMSLAGRAM